ncbi:MAG: hypothetical protein IPG32_10050 [Saprospirales bacterium]|nr:hypothetical protein [Saprospirales bacterium]
MRGLRVISIGLQNLPAFVGGSIVDQDQLEILVGLVQDALDALMQEAPVVEIRDDNTYGGRGGVTGHVQKR